MGFWTTKQMVTSLASAPPAGPTCGILKQNYNDSENMLKTLEVVPGQASLKKWYKGDMTKLTGQMKANNCPI